MTAARPGGSGWVTGHVCGADDVVALDGDGVLLTGGRIVAAAEELLVRPGAKAGEGELLPGVPVIRRGDAWIIPLSWEPPAAGRPDSALRRRSQDLRSSIRSACEFRHGFGITADLETHPPANPYLGQLRRQQARFAGWWATEGKALVLVEHGDPVPEPVSAAALHVVPVGWVSDARRTRRVPEVDVGWTGPF